MPNTTRSLAGSFELHPVLGPEPFESAIPSPAGGGAMVLTTQELAEARSVAVPPAPALERFGYRVSHITGRYVLGGSRDAYCIWKFQSAAPPIEFPMTPDGWAGAWTTFRGLEAQDNESRS